MRCPTTPLLLLAAGACAAVSTPAPLPLRVPPPPHIAAALAADGFDVDTAFTYGSGVGVSASSRSATINGNASLMKPAFYVSGTGFEMGYLLGYIAAPRVEAMTSTFLLHIVPALISEELDAWLQNSTLAPAYDALCAALAALLEEDSIRYYNASLAAGALPAELDAELRGVAAGAAAALPTTDATFERIVTLNIGYDMLLALIFTGEILDLLVSRAAAAGAAPATLAILRALPPRALRPPVLCNAFAARGSRTASSSPLFGRRVAPVAAKETFPGVAHAHH